MQPREPGDPERVGAYRVLGRLGEGGMGVVYLALSPGGRTVAVKVIQPRFVAGPEHRARFRREVSAARRVSGTFTAPVLDADPDTTAPWLVTAYLPGMSLWKAVRAFGAMPAIAVRALAAGLAEALHAIHGAGVVHRDLKPDNIMLTAGGPKVIDFGIARPEDAAAITQVGRTMGTTRYASPEQRAGSAVGPESDIYSLGTVLVFAATGDASDQGWDPRAITDRWLREAAEDCLRWKPAHRPSAASLLDRLGHPHVSLQGTGWLPAPVAEAVDRQTAHARHLPALPAPPAIGTPDVVPSVVSGATAAAPAATPRRPGQRRLSRRGLLGAAAAGVAALAAGAAGVRQLGGGQRRPAAALWTPGSPVEAGSPVEQPPLASLRWQARVTTYYPDLTVGGGAVQAWTNDDVHVLDPRTGEIRWEHTTGGTTVSAGGTGGTAAGELAYLYDGGQLIAFQAGSGATRWTYEPPFGEFPIPGPAVTGSVACTGTADDRLVRALGVDDGRPRWTAPVSAENGIAARDGLVAALSPGALAGLAAGNGETMWTYEIDEGFRPAIGDGLVYACDRHYTLHAVRIDDGKLAWRRPVDSYGLDLPLAGGLLYVCTFDGRVQALRADTGEPVWSRRLGGGEGAAYGHMNRLGLAGRTLYVAATNQTVYALDRSTNRLLWRHFADVTLNSPPVSLDGLAFIGTRDGSVHALGPPDGGPRATA